MWRGGSTLEHGLCSSLVENLWAYKHVSSPILGRCLVFRLFAVSKDPSRMMMVFPLSYVSVLGGVVGESRPY